MNRQKMKQVAALAVSYRPRTMDGQQGYHSIHFPRNKKRSVIDAAIAHIFAEIDVITARQETLRWPVHCLIL